MFRTLESPNIDGFKVIKLIGVSNGLVFLSVGEEPSNFILWNPTIRRYVPLPLTMTWDDDQSCLGFGFDSKHNDFKVVNLVHRHLFYGHRPKIDEIWIFSCLMVMETSPM